MKCRKSIYIILVFVFTLMYTPNFLWAEEPGKVLMTAIDKGLIILKDPSLKGDGKTQERRQKLWKEIAPMFNFEEMSKRTLGRYWRKRSPEEKKGFVELFTKILKDTYVGQTDAYSGEKVVYQKEKQDDSYATVQTKFITSSGTEIDVDYRLINNQGKWGIYDVIIEGVSMVNNYRSQFYSILSKSSYEKLLQMIKKKAQQSG